MKKLVVNGKQYLSRILMCKHSPINCNPPWGNKISKELGNIVCRNYYKVPNFGFRLVNTHFLVWVDRWLCGQFRRLGYEQLEIKWGGGGGGEKGWEESIGPVKV